MSSTITLLILLVSFVGFVYCMYKGYNSMLCFFAVSLIWSICAGKGLKGILDVFATGAQSGATTMLLIIIGSWFGHMMMETGIISGIIKKAVEYSGGKPFVICTLMCIITTFIFMTGYGSGVVIAVGVIVLPIMFSLGVPKTIGASAFALSIGAGLYMNPIMNNISFTPLKGIITDQQKSAYLSFAFIPLLIQLVVTLVVFIISLRRNANFKRTSAWAADAVADPGHKDAPTISYIIPIVPIVLYMITKIDMVPIYYVTFIVLLILTGNFGKGKKPIAILMKSLKDGVSDVAVLYGFIIGMQTFITSANAAQNLLGGFFGSILPSSAFVLIIGLIILAPLALFRGPLTLYGAGAAVALAVFSAAVYPPTMLLVALVVVSTSFCYSFCPTIGWNAWILNYTQVKMSGYLKRCLAQQWPLLAVLLVIVYFIFK